MQVFHGSGEKARDPVGLKILSLPFLLTRTFSSGRECHVVLSWLVGSLISVATAMAFRVVLLPGMSVSSPILEGDPGLVVGERYLQPI